MVCSIDEWRKELEAIDAELVRLLNRRVQLALDLLIVLRSEELTLGTPELDIERMTIFLSNWCVKTSPPLAKRAVQRILTDILQESQRVAWKQIRSKL